MTAQKKRTELLAKREELQAERDVAALEQELRRIDLDSRQIVEAWGDVISPSAGFDDNPDYVWGGPAGLHISRPDDRKDGDNAPHWRTEEELARIRGIGEYISQTDSTAIGALANLTNYTIGKGFDRRIEPKKGQPEQAAKLAQQVVEEFLDRTGWQGEGERESFQRLHRSGESIRHVVDMGGGMAGLKTIEPSWVVEPTNGDMLSDHYGIDAEWKYGIAADLGNPECQHYLYVAPYGEHGAAYEAPVDDVIHLKANVDANVKRGVSDFYAVWQDMNRAAKLLDNTVQGAALQACIAWIEKHTGATKSQIESAAQSRIDYRSTVARQGGGSTQVDYERVRPGRIVRTNDKSDFAYGPLGTPQGNNFITVVQAAFRHLGQRWTMAEYMISGDASNANYSSTLVAASPFVKSVEPMQDYHVRKDKRLLWAVLRIAVHGGRFASLGIRDVSVLRSLIEVIVEAPDAAVRDDNFEHTKRKDLYDRGIMSDATWAAKEGLDLEQERANDPGATRRAAAFQPQLQAVNTAGATVAESRLLDLKFSLLEGIDA
jgi:hypothetical protein